MFEEVSGLLLLCDKISEVVIIDIYTVSILIIWQALIAQLDERPTGDQEVAGFDFCLAPATFFLKYFSTVILSLPPIQEGQLLVSGERIYTSTR